MKKLFQYFFIFVFVFGFTSCETLQALLGGESDGITNEEAIYAFKTSMNIGASFAANSLGQKDGFFGNELLKILLPEEADILLENLVKIPGGQKLVDDVILRINRSAETAAKDVAPIFAQAIREMTVMDGLEIVFGEKNAGTNYLREKTYEKLVNLFAPKMQECLNSPLVLGVSANKAWEKLLFAYNTVAAPFNQTAKLFGKPEPMPAIVADLGQYTTQKALDGLFSKVESEETKIRDVPMSYEYEIIQKVFSYVKEHKQ
ncbi:MAG: DUF4197 domain-containing protein [Treponemataceae bacterium]